MKTYRTKRLNRFSLKLFYKGTENLSYEMKEKGKVIFKGDDYKPSPLYAIDSIESIYGLLSFLTVKVGEAEKGYFEGYTKAQLKWLEGKTCETLISIIYRNER